MDARAGTSDIVHIRDVHFAWPDARGFALDIKNFTIKTGERVLLLGPSGSGKSTFLSLLAGVISPSKGSITTLSAELTKMTSMARDRFRAEHFGIIFQMFNLLPYGAVIDNVLLPLSFAPARRNRSVQNDNGRAEACRLMEALGLNATLIDAPAATLSVGQQQRVAAARALIGSPEIIIADEPTSALDRSHQHQFLELLFEQVTAAKSTLIMVSHDENFAPQFDRVCNLADIIHVEPTS